MLMPSITGWHRRFSHQAEWTSQVREYLFGRALPQDGGTVIEVGCGTGAVLSRLPTSARRFGLDIDAAFLRHAAEVVPDTPLICGDAHRLPFSSGCFDIACCHFLLLWVADPLCVLREMTRVSKPGGAVLVLAEPDYGGRIDHPDTLTALGAAQTSSLRKQGADPLVGRKLPGMLHAAGLVDIEIGIIGSQWQPPLPPGHQESEWETLHHDLGNDLTGAELAQYQTADRAAWENGSRVLFVPTFYAFGLVPPVTSASPTPKKT